MDETLGKGGMGSVYRCHNRDAPSIVAAIKLLDPSVPIEAAAERRFLREAEILYRIDHPHVVRVSNVDLDASPPYLEMEFVEGHSLEEELERHGPLPLPTAIDRIRQLADALHHLHRRKIFHRDIKPQNIIITPDGAVKLVDFGLAIHRAEDPETTGITTFGTVPYCPPEWGLAKLDDPLWDLYALGVVFYEMLTGTVAFPVAKHLEPLGRMQQVLADKRRIAALDPGPDFPPDVRTIIRTLTCREPEGRYPDARTLLHALDEADLTPVRPIPTERPRSRENRPPAVPRPVYVGLLLLAAVLGAGALLAGMLAFSLVLGIA